MEFRKLNLITALVIVIAVSVAAALAFLRSL